MVMSSRDGTLPVGWWVRADLEGDIEGRPLMAVFVARVSDPGDAEDAVRGLRPTLRNIKAGDTVKLETFERLSIAPGEAWGPL